MSTLGGLQLGIAAAALTASSALAGEWVSFNEETSTRLVASNNLGAGDVEEKDYAWGDLDHDGDTDLVCVRKQPFSTLGRRPNVLFMNEGIADGHPINGVLVDRTAQYASDADDGGNGFLDETNDRDVVLADVNGDGWLDIITSTTLGDDLPKTISHPRIYINKGEIDGNWQGFRYEEARFPQIYTIAGLAVAPRFNAVDAGDVTGDGFPDLYFVDHDSSGGVPQPPGADVNDRLFINDGKGNFVDSLQERMTAEMLLSAFGLATAIRDMNGDGVLDIVKDTGMNQPVRVSISYNDPDNEGYFNRFSVPYNGFAPYFVNVGELNNDGKLDMVVMDDGTDRYLLNTGNDANDVAQFQILSFPSGPSAGFGGNIVIDDLDQDGFNDVLIADVDAEIAGCSRRLHIYRNLANPPNISLIEDGSVLPPELMTGTHDVAVFDINGDGWLDLVIGRCAGTSIWINVPPIGITFTYPQGLPDLLPPDESVEFAVEISGFGGAEPEPGSGMLHYSINNGPFFAAPMTEQSPNEYVAQLPALACHDRVQFYVSAQMIDGGTFTDPPDAPGSSYFAVAGAGFETVYSSDFEEDTSGWSVTNSAELVTGAWEAVDPIGTFVSGQPAAPEDDATPGAGNVIAFITENGEPGEGPAESDVDGGFTMLYSPVIDLSGIDATISYDRWFFCDDAGDNTADFLQVYITNDNQNWVPLETVADTGSAWQNASFLVSDFVEPTATIVVRFDASDIPNNSITEAGVDNFLVERIVCTLPCPADLDDSGDVGFDDFITLLSYWGPCDGCAADIDGDGNVGFDDFTTLLASWGPCP